jgi:membrane associated rhomboid family serine protease
MTVLDDADPANKDAIAEAIMLRKQLMQPSWVFPAAFAAAALGFLVTAKLSGDMAVGQLGMYAGLVAWMIMAAIIGHKRLTPAWHAAIEHFDGESGLRALRHRQRTSTTVIAALLLLAFVSIQLKVGTEQVVYYRGAAPWRLVTSSLSHSGPIHLIGNLIALFAFGSAIDLRVGRLATAGVLAAAAIGGALAQAWYSPEPMLGFSGAIMGLAGATVALMPTRKTVLVLQGIAIPMPTWLWSLFWLGIITATAWADTRGHVAWVAHLGGFVAGFLVGLPMRKLPPTESFALFEQRRQERVERIASR